MKLFLLLLSFVASSANAYIPTGGYEGYKTPVADAASLPAIGNVAGDARITLDTYGFYIWNGATWQCDSCTSGSPSVAWGAITGTLGSQADLAGALALKSTIASPTFTGHVHLPFATEGNPAIQFDGDTGYNGASDGETSETNNGVVVQRWHPGGVDITVPLTVPSIVFPSQVPSAIFKAPIGGGVPSFQTIATGELVSSMMQLPFTVPLTGNEGQVVINSDSDTGLSFPFDGIISFLNNNGLTLRLSPSVIQAFVDFSAPNITASGDIHVLGSAVIDTNTTVTGNLTSNTVTTPTITVSGNASVAGDLTVNTINGSSYPQAPSGAHLAVAGYDNTGALGSIPNTFYTDYNGLYSTVQAPAGAGDVNMFGLYTASALVTGNVNGIIIGNQLQSTGNTSLIDANNGAPVGADLNALRFFNTGAITGGMNFAALNNSGNFTGQFRMIEAINSGTGGGGIFANLSNSAAQSGGMTMLNIANSAPVTGDLSLEFAQSNSAVSGNFAGTGVNYNGPSIGGAATLATFGINGAPTVGGGLTGLNVYSDAAVTGNSNMMFISDSGSATDKSALIINTTGTATGNAKAITANLNNVTTPNRKYVFDGTGGTFNSTYDMDTSVYDSPSFSDMNHIGGQFIIASGSPHTGVHFGNNLSVNYGFSDDWLPDNTLGTSSLGASNISSLMQFQGGAGKTLNTFQNLLLVGTSGAGAGTITNYAAIRSTGVVSFGGSLGITNSHIYEVDPVYDGALGTNKWGFWNGSSSSNWMKGNLTLGGTTGLPEAGQVLDVIGPTRLRDLSIAGYVITDANGHISSSSGLTNASTLDSAFTVKKAADVTAKIGFDASAISTATTRSLKMPDANVDLGGLTNSNISSSAAIDPTKIDFTNVPITLADGSTAVTQPAGDNSNLIATTEYVDDLGLNGFLLQTSSAQPSCNVGNRGLLWIIQGGAGVADIFQICQKTVLNTYVWATH